LHAHVQDIAWVSGNSTKEASRASHGEELG
jgi:hypothetical protein